MVQHVLSSESDADSNSSNRALPKWAGKFPTVPGEADECHSTMPELGDLKSLASSTGTLAERQPVMRKAPR